jgi:hypothetical protein
VPSDQPSRGRQSTISEDAAVARDVLERDLLEATVAERGEVAQSLTHLAQADEGEAGMWDHAAIGRGEGAL